MYGNTYPAKADSNNMSHGGHQDKDAQALSCVLVYINCRGIVSS